MINLLKSLGSIIKFNKKISNYNSKQNKKFAYRFGKTMRAGILV